MSRDAPPPLPGGYKVGEKVFYARASFTFPSGDKLVHGQQGEVTGPATAESHKGKGVEVLFPGNKGTLDCGLNQVRRRRRHAATRSCAQHPSSPPLSAHRTYPRVPCVGATGKPPGATVAAGRLHGGRAGLLHGDE